MNPHDSQIHCWASLTGPVILAHLGLQAKALPGMASYLAGVGRQSGRRRRPRGQKDLGGATSAGRDG